MSKIDDDARKALAALTADVVNAESAVRSAESDYRAAIRKAAFANARDADERRPFVRALAVTGATLNAAEATLFVAQVALRNAADNAVAIANAMGAAKEKP